MTSMSGGVLLKFSKKVDTILNIVVQHGIQDCTQDLSVFDVLWFAQARLRVKEGSERFSDKLLVHPFPLRDSRAHGRTKVATHDFVEG